MFQEIEVNKGDAVSNKIAAFRISEKLTHLDYEQFLPRIQGLFLKHEKLSLLLILDDFHGWDLDAVKDDLHFALTHRNSFKQIALIGDKHWEHWMTLVAKPFWGGKVRFFWESQIQDALNWLQKSKPSDELAGSLFSSSYHHVLLATDFSLQAEHAAYRAVEIAKQFEAKVSLLLFSDSYIDEDVFESEEHKLGNAFVKRTHKRLQKFIEKTKVANIQTEFLTGNPQEGILKYSREHNVDLIVMGTNGDKGEDHLISKMAD